jgi:glycosyltransferase involved in cell wall biosynthesis
MFPTYNCSDLLERALRSVLEQDPGPERMQIAVVDDCSTTRRHEEIVRSIAPDRVELYRQPIHRGLGGNWNTCVAQSRGRWVHILHQDDLVLPGFYDRLARAGERPDVGAAFCHHWIVDDGGRKLIVMPLERPTAGVLEDLLEKITQEQHIHCPSIVIRRDVYERLGGFREDLCYTLDWEMWVRIAAAYPVWYEPELLAHYRLHDANETHRLTLRGLTVPDMLKSIRIVSRRLPPAYQGRVGRLMLTEIRDRSLRSASEALQRNDLRSGMVHLAHAIRLDPSVILQGPTFNLSKWAIKIGLLKFLSRLRGRRPGAPANEGDPASSRADRLAQGSSGTNQTGHRRRVQDSCDTRSGHPG